MPEEAQHSRVARLGKAGEYAAVLRPAMVLSLWVSLASGCVDADPPVLRVLVTVVASQAGQPAEDATAQLVQHGRRALVVIEAAMHTADPAGRRRLVRAIRRLGDEDGAPLLGHLARYDAEPSVREEAHATLASWAAESGPRAVSAGRALTSLETLRHE